MEVRDHRLYDADGSAVRFVPSPNHSDELEPRYLVIHYTATLTLEPAVAWFQNPKSDASAHFLVSRSGRVVQMVRLDRQAWHAGRSTWGAVENLNAYSIGIELVNAGALARAPAGHWIDWARHRIPDADVIVARHKHERAERGWHAFTEVQIERAIQIAAGLHERYRFRNVLGHDDVAASRKLDPGPAFPMERFVSGLMRCARNPARLEARA
jgi:N-acetylmuramoyl-L-alanine amidase